MKSNICRLNERNDLSNILNEVEKSATYNELNKKQSLQLRLLAEELVVMLPELLDYYEGQFWVSSQNKKFALHVALSAPEMSYDERENLLSVSSSGKNAAAVGIMGKIRAAAETLLLYADSPEAAPAYVYSMDASPDMVFTSSTYYAYEWTLDQYRHRIQQQEESAWDELEKSIVANLADDVVVGIKGRQVDIVVKKSFA